MLLVVIAFLMKFVDITKMQSQRCCPSSSSKACNNKTCLQHHQQYTAELFNMQRHKQHIYSNSSSTSSGCDSGASSGSSKENYYALPHKLQQQVNESITPQQLQQLRYYQQLQRQQLCLLQQQLLQRRRLQQKLREKWDGGSVGAPRRPTTLTCNQQYLLQQQQKPHQQQQHAMLKYTKIDEDNNNNVYDINQLICIENAISNNNNNNNNTTNHRQNTINCGGVGVENNNFNGLFEGQKFRRGMTEFSTKNDIKQNKASHSPSSQPLQNSPCHQYYYNLNTNAPQNHTNNNKSHVTQISLQKQQQQQPHHHQQQSQLLQDTFINFKTNAITPNSPKSQLQAQQHSPLHYKKPLNSPSNSQFAYAYKQQQQLQQQPQQQKQQQKQQLQHNNKLLLQQMRCGNTTKPQQPQQQQQQHHRCPTKLGVGATSPSSYYTKNLNDLLAQQQQLQQQHQQLLHGEDSCEADAEISEESLKQNVAIVLNNLDRYNNALRSIILNEQVTNSIYFEDTNITNNNNYNNYNNNNNSSGDNNNNNNNNIFLHISEGGLSVGRGGDNKIMATAATPESDYNSNATTTTTTTPGYRYDQQQHLVGLATTATSITTTTKNGGGGGVIGGSNSNNDLGAFGYGGNNLNCSLASEHDFTHDNSDYQWFVDYGYRDGCGGMQRSVLSSLSGSAYNNSLSELTYYDDIAKNLDANLAEVDMESFRAEDINSLLWQLPSYCQRLANGNQRLQQSLLLQQQQDQQQEQNDEQQHQIQQHQQLQQQNRQQTSTTSSSNELIDNSICKSELLFSPVKDSHVSMVESLDMDNYPDDGDMILTCQANKDNYTIAFEGSILYSDESYYAEPAEIAMKNRQNLHHNLDDTVERRSEQAKNNNNNIINNNYKSELQKDRIMHLQRYPSGNNNTTTDALTVDKENSILHQQEEAEEEAAADVISVRKSNSLPNLNDVTTNIQYTVSNQSSAKNSPPQTPLKQQQEHRDEQLNVSQAVNALSSKSSRNMLPMCQIPICCDSQNCYEHQQQESQQPTMNNKHRHKHHRYSADIQAQQLQKQQLNNMSSTYSSSSGSSNTPAFNLVKLFIKQKSNNSSSVEGEVESVAMSSNVNNNNQNNNITCMDVSSGCWPSSDAAGSSSSSSSLEQRLRKKSMNDSGKGSALSKHEEEEPTQAVFYAESDEVATPNRLRPSPLQASNLRRHTQVSNLINNNSKLSVGSSQQSTSSNEQMTQIEANKRESSSEMVTRSMQTSCSTGNSTQSSVNERLRLVPPSFLSKLHKLGEANQAPIYVIYPNYALPDLAFVNQTNATTDQPDIIYSSFNYKTANSQTSNTKKDKKQLLEAADVKHVQDWHSLLTLLPAQYRESVKHLPEVREVVKAVEKNMADRPLFCMSPPVKRSRSNFCDCAQYDVQQSPVGGSSSSVSSQQPNSSGYRGSSTLLTDSEFDRHAMSNNQQFERRDSGVECTPKTPTPPQPKPRGILRRSHNVGSKRNSMIETAQQQTRLSKLEKRRSLQEPPYAHLEEAENSQLLANVFEDEELRYVTPAKTRLSRRDLDARARAENFLSSLPRNELKYYAEIAAILESSNSSDMPEEQVPAYDAAALKKEVSRVLSQQKKVSFNEAANEQNILPPTIADTKRFSTPPNSPNISMARVQNNGVQSARRYAVKHNNNKPETLDAKEQIKIEHNRFKRLQIQWELLSKDSSMLKELALEHQTQSGGSTPTSGPLTPKSRIPRPVSYPAGKKLDKLQTNETKTPSPKSPANVITKPKNPSSPHIARITAQDGKHTATNSAKSPSRLVPPKRYSTTTPTSTTTPSMSGRARTPNSRTPVTAPNTPKRQVPTMIRANSRVR